MQHKATAPGSLMLMGEHAVLHGKPALVCAVDKRMSVTLTPREDNCIEISSLIGKHNTRISEIEVQKPFLFVLAVLKKFQDKFQQGFNFHIESEFSTKLGFGSSAAVTAATLAVMNDWLDLSLPMTEQLRIGQGIIREVQGAGSGADLAASLNGGIVHFTADPLHVEKIEMKLPLNAIYSGYKTETPVVLQHVRNYFVGNEAAYNEICNQIGECVIEAKKFLHAGDLKSFGGLMTRQQKYMEELNVSSPLLDKIIKDLCQQSGIFGAKISGSGLGDCIIGLGELADSFQCVVDNQALPCIPFSVTMRGVSCEKI